MVAGVLFLSRRVGESTIISDSIEVKVIEIKGKNVKLGFSFPDDIRVFRKELYDKIIKENNAAASSVESLKEIIK